MDETLQYRGSTVVECHRKGYDKTGGRSLTCRTSFRRFLKSSWRVASCLVFGRAYWEPPAPSCLCVRWRLEVWTGSLRRSLSREIRNHAQISAWNSEFVDSAMPCDALLDFHGFCWVRYFKVNATVFHLIWEARWTACLFWLVFSCIDACPLFPSFQVFEGKIIKEQLLDC